MLSVQQDGGTDIKLATYELSHLLRCHLMSDIITSTHGSIALVVGGLIGENARVRARAEKLRFNRNANSIHSAHDNCVWYTHAHYLYQRTMCARSSRTASTRSTAT